MKYLDSQLGWTEPEVGPKAHAIYYKGAGACGFDHSAGYPLNGNQGFGFTVKPAEAVAGDAVTVTYKSDIFSSYAFGITDASVQSITDESQLEEMKDSYFTPGDSFTYSFTMPDYDVTVWVWCQTSSHGVI